MPFLSVAGRTSASRPTGASPTETRCCHGNWGYEPTGNLGEGVALPSAHRAQGCRLSLEPQQGQACIQCRVQGSQASCSGTGQE